MKNLGLAFQRFWFEFDPGENLKTFRIVFGGTLLLSYLERFLRFDQYFGSQRFCNLDQAIALSPGFYRPAFFWSFWPDSWNLAIYLLLLTGLVVFICGRGGRLLGLLLWVVSYGFIQRNPPIVFGADFIGALFLLYTVLTPILSKNKTGFLNRLGTSVGCRMIQVQLCVIYFYSGAEKLKGVEWWDGTALWAILSSPQIATFDFGFLRNFSFILALSTYLTLLFELFFPTLVWNHSLRKPFLIWGFLMHIGIALFMGMWTFSMVMVSTYVLFFKTNEAKG